MCWRCTGRRRVRSLCGRPAAPIRPDRQHRRQDRPLPRRSRPRRVGHYRAGQAAGRVHRPRAGRCRDGRAGTQFRCCRRSAPVAAPSNSGSSDDYGWTDGVAPTVVHNPDFDNRLHLGHGPVGRQTRTGRDAVPTSSLRAHAERRAVWPPRNAPTSMRRRHHPARPNGDSASANEPQGQLRTPISMPGVPTDQRATQRSRRGMLAPADP